MRQFIPYFIIEQYKQGQRSGEFEALTMFIDLSGFTSLTEAFMQQGIVGAEQLSMQLNGIFGPLVKLVYEREGFIPYFAGDAFTAIFPMDKAAVNIDELIHTAIQINDFFEERGILHTDFGDFEIGIKIGLSAGTVDWGIVGEAHPSYYFRGFAIDGCAHAQMHAKEQEIVFDEAIKEILPAKLLSARKIRNENLYLIKKVDRSQLHVETDCVLVEPIVTMSDKKVVTQFIPESVLRFNQIGEFRPVISVFIAFKNVETYDLLNAFSTIVLDQIHAFSGYFKEIDFGDKGGVMVAFFGAPISFENNMERAIEFTLALDAETKALRKKSKLRYKIGLTAGTAFTGTIGGKERIQYAVVGTEVNLAARLMSYANWGEVSVDDELRKEKQYLFRHKGDINYKGIRKQIPTYILEGRKDESEHVFSGKLVGRNEELEALEAFVLPIQETNKARLAYLYGEAGIGKSRLVYEFVNRMVARVEEQGEDAVSPKRVTCQADQILQKPFNPFIYFLRVYFEQSPQKNRIANQENFERIHQDLLTKLQTQQAKASEKETYARLIQETERTKPILGALIGIRYDDSLWEQLDAKGRYQNIFSALINLMTAEATLQPLMIELEDAHWFDDSSKAFLETFVRQIKDLPILLLVTSRYLDDASKPLLIAAEKIEEIGMPLMEIDLNILKADALREFAEDYLKGAISKEFFQLLQRTTNGNPFYLEQILEYFSESKLLIKKGEKWHIKDKNIKLSNSINAILMARIDRLSSLVKETVKAAAVIGREFDVPVLSEVMKVQDEFVRRNGNMLNVLHEQIETAERGQIWRAMNELRYIFKHSLLRETVYDMQLKTRLRELHKLIAEAIEKLYDSHIDDRYDDLAFHYEQAEEWDKAKFYLEKAAEQAERNFQNRQALRLYDRKLALIDIKKERPVYIKMLLQKGRILESIGDWENCEMTFTLALETAMFGNEKLLEARANNNLGRLLMLKGNYEDAKEHLETARDTFKSIDDTLGIAKAFGNLGNLFFRQGQYELAKEYFVESMSISRALPYNSATAQIVSNLGLTHMNQGNYAAGIQCQQEQLELASAKNDKQGMATLLTNLGIVYFEKGDLTNALDSYEKGLALSQELGNKLLTSIAIGCIGSVYQRKGDYAKAQENFEFDLVLTQEMGDKQGIAIVHGLLGDLYALKGEFDLAIPNLEKQLVLCRELNYQKGIAKALNTLGDVHCFQEKYEASLSYYDRAIEVTRKIDNKLVLGTSLIEKAYALLGIQRIEEAHVLQQEAQDLAQQLGNKDLIFEATALAARLMIIKGENTQAFDTLKALQATAHSARYQAGLLYELSKLDADYAPKALAAYEKLYKETPTYLFKLRIDILKK